MKKFPWGRIINTFVYYFDGVEVLMQSTVGVILPIVTRRRMK